MTKKRDLILGWRLSESLLKPTYSPERRKARDHPTDHDLIRVEGKSLNHHTAIVGQSGSGKSFFLARLIEELLICTRARCIILDPNADFRLFREPEPADELTKKSEKLPGEIPADNKFRECWGLVTQIVYSGTMERSPNRAPLKLPWPVLSVDAIATGDDSSDDRDELNNCHEFIKNICYLMALAYLERQETGSANELEGQETGSANELDMLRWPKDILTTARKREKDDKEQNAEDGTMASASKSATFEAILDREIRQRFKSLKKGATSLH